MAACGSDDDGEGTESASAGSGIPEEFAAPTTAPNDAQEGGELTVIASDDIDYMDPGAAYYQYAYMLMSAAHRTLLSWPPANSSSRPPTSPKRIRRSPKTA